MAGWLRRFPGRGWGLLLLAVAGCGGIGSLDSVSGKVTLDGKPLAGVMVNYAPDAQKGNKTPFGVSGFTDGEGVYRLQTSTRTGRTYSGAPPGWYKVTVSPGLSNPEAVATTERGKGKSAGTGSAVPPRYGRPDQTPFQFEVVGSPNPGAYDLKLTSK